MAKLNLLISTSLSKETLRQKFERSTSSKHATVEAMSQFLEGLQSGTQFGTPPNPPSVVSSIEGYSVQATGTLTFTSAVATNTFVINGVTFTGIASGATGNQFNIGVSDTATAANAAAAINASVSALISGLVTATSALGVVTVTSVQYGLSGNQATLVGSTNIVASAARLTGGAADSGSKTYTF